MVKWCALVAIFGGFAHATAEYCESSTISSINAVWTKTEVGKSCLAKLNTDFAKLSKGNAKNLDDADNIKVCREASVLVDAFVSYLLEDVDDCSLTPSITLEDMLWYEDRTNIGSWNDVYKTNADKKKIDMTKISSSELKSYFEYAMCDEDSFDFLAEAWDSDDGSDCMNALGTSSLQSLVEFGATSKKVQEASKIDACKSVLEATKDILIDIDDMDDNCLVNETYFLLDNDSPTFPQWISVMRSTKASTWPKIEASSSKSSTTTTAPVVSNSSVVPTPTLTTDPPSTTTPRLTTAPPPPVVASSAPSWSAVSLVVWIALGLFCI